MVKRIVALYCLCVSLLVAQRKLPSDIAYIGVFANLPAAGLANQLAIVTDCANPACTAGSGSLARFLRDTGAAWTPLGDGNSAVTTQLPFSSSMTFTALSDTHDSWYVVLTGNVTSSSLTNQRVGQLLTFRICQDATGGRTFAWPTGFTAALAPSPTPNACTVQSFVWDGTNAVMISGMLGGATAMLETAAPTSNPPNGYYYTWVDSTDHMPHNRDASGNINSYVRTASSRVNNQFVTHIAPTGLPQTAAITDEDVPDNITINLAATANALSTDPSGCTNQVVTDIAANGALTCSAVSASMMSSALTRRVCDIVIGDQAGDALTNAKLGPQKRLCFIPAAATVVEIIVSADAGTPSITLASNTNGTVSNLTSTALATAANGGVACAKTTASTGIDGVTTCSATLQNTSLPAGSYIEAVSGAAGGTAKLFTAHVVYTIN